MVAPILHTDRLILRPFREADLDAYAALGSDPLVMEFLSADGSLLSRADAWRQMSMFLGHWELRGYGTWAVEERSSGEFVGRVGLHYPEGWPDRELGWTIARKFWGQGYASEAARAAIAHAFGALGWTHLVSLIHPDNHRSARLAERLGYHIHGVAEIRDLHLTMYRLDRSPPPTDHTSVTVPRETSPGHKGGSLGPGGSNGSDPSP
jgi:RimJ/RimL family protein N-acetyltransferase